MDDLIVMSRGLRDDYCWRRAGDPAAGVGRPLPDAWPIQALVDSSLPWLLVGRGEGRLYLVAGGLTTSRTDLFGRAIRATVVVHTGWADEARVRGIASAYLRDPDAFARLVDERVVERDEPPGWEIGDLRAALAALELGAASASMSPVPDIQWAVAAMADHADGESPRAESSASEAWRRAVAAELAERALPEDDGIALVWSHNGDPLAFEEARVRRGFTVIHGYRRADGTSLDADAFARELDARRAAREQVDALASDQSAAKKMLRHAPPWLRNVVERKLG